MNINLRLEYRYIAVWLAGLLLSAPAYAKPIKRLAGGFHCEAMFWMAHNGIVMIAIAVIIGVGIYAKQIPFLWGVLVVAIVALAFRIAQLTTRLTQLMNDFGCSAIS